VHCTAGGETELLLSTIDLGLLVPARNQFKFANDPTAHREYFQTTPHTRQVVSYFESVNLAEVMLPTGVLLTTVDPSVGGVYTGDMREYIGKALYSEGIDNANEGVWASDAVHVRALTMQITPHNSIGNYSNGVIIHGLSGGGGRATLWDSLGNEMSHELGHNYGLGHYDDKWASTCSAVQPGAYRAYILLCL